MADGTNTEDILGRDLSSLVTSIDALKSILSQTKTSIEQKLSGTTPDAAGLKDILQEVIKGFGDAASEQEKFVQEVIKSLKGVDIARVQKQADSKLNKPRMKEEIRFNKKLERIQEKIQRKNRQDWLDTTEALVRQTAERLGKSWEHTLDYLEKINDDKGIEQLQAQFDALQPEKVKLILENTEDLVSGIGRARDENEELNKAMEKYHSAISNVRYQLYDISRVLQSFEGFTGLETTKTLFADVYETERKFTQEMRQIAFETAGVTKESFGLQRAYENIGKTVKATGFDRTKFQESYRKALKSGMKDLKQAVAMTSTQLNTEKQLGLEAGSLQENFQQMVQSGRMSNNQIADMGRGMRQVARTTGLTGDALKGVIDSSMQFVDQMRKAATLSSAASKNIIELGANAKKLGVEEEMNKLRTGLASSTSLLTEAAGETQSLIFLAASRVGRVQDAMNGTLLRSKAGIKDFAQGMKSILQGFGVDSLEAIDQLGDEAKRVLNLQLKATVGMELGAFRSVIESYEEAGKSLGERLDSINKKMEGNLTISEKNALVEEKRALKTAKQLEVLTVLDEAAKGAKNMDQALAKFGERRKEFEGDLKGLGLDFQNDADVIRGSLEGAVKDINAGLKKSGKSELKIDSSEIEKAIKDPAAFRELTSKIVEGEKELATAQKAQLDPLTQTNQTLTEINDSLRNLSQSVISNLLTGVVGQFIMLAGVIAGLGSYLAGTIVGSIIDLNKMVDKVFFGVSEYGGKTNSLLKNIEIILGGKPKEDKKDQTPSPTTTPQSPTTTNPKGTEQPKEAKTGAIGSIGNMFSGQEGKDLAKAAAAILALSVGIVALGSAIVFLADKVMASFDLDLNKVMQTAQLVGAIAMAGGVIAAAGIAAFEAMNTQAAQDFVSGINGTRIKQFLLIGAALMILGPAVVGLGASIVAVTNMILSKLNVDVNRVLEVAGVVTALGAAATGMIFAVMEFTDFVDQHRDHFDNLVRNLGKYLYYMAVGGGAIFALSLGIVTLAALIVKSSQLILSVFGLDAATADKVAENIAHLFGAVAVISAAVLATTAALVGLGILATMLANPIAGSGTALTVIPLILMGAGALLALSLVMPLLAAAVIALASAGTSLVSGNDAIEAAQNIGKLLLAAGAIALGVLGATAGLIGLGFLVYSGDAGLKWPAMIGLMALGAVVLLALTPAITFLAGAIVHLANAAMGVMGVEPEFAAKVAETFGSIMISAGKIALGVLAAAYALGFLGSLIPFAPYYAAVVAGGAIALYFLIDPMTKLASSIIELTSQVLGEIVSQDEAEKAGKAISSIFAAAGTIAYEITKSMVSLGALGLLSIGSVGLIPGLMAVGAYALEEMTAPVVHYVQTVMRLGDQVRGIVRGEDAEKIAKEIKSVFEMAAAVTSLMSSQQGGLLSVSKYGDWWNYTKSWVFLGQTISQQMDSANNSLESMIDPVVLYIQKIKEFSNEVRSKLGSSDKDAIESAKSIIGVLNAAGDVTTQIMKAKDALTTLQSGDWTSWLTFGFSDVPSRMKAGALVLPDLGSPIGLYLQSIVQFTNNVKSNIGSKTPEYMASLASGLVTIMKSAGEITEQIMKTKDSLLKIKNNDWTTFFGGGTISKRMEDGKQSFASIASVVPDYLNSVYEVAKDIKSKLKAQPDEVAARAYEFVVIFDQINKITGKINEIKPMMLKFAAENKVAGQNRTFVQAIDKAKISLMLIRGALINYMTYSMQFAKDIVAIVPAGETRRILSQVDDISKIVSITAKMVSQMRDEILPNLTKNTKTLKTQELSEAQKKIGGFFPTLITLMNGIRTQVKNTAGNLSEFEDSITHIARMNDVVKSFGEIMQVLSSDAFSQANLKKVNDALLVLNGYKQQVRGKWVDVTGIIDTLSSFISDKLIVRVRTMANVDELRETATKLNFTAAALSQLLLALSELPPIFTRSENYLQANTLQGKFDRLDDSLVIIAKFIKDKLITRVNEFPEKGKLNNTKYMLEDLAQVLRATLNAVVALNAIFVEMEKNPVNAWANSSPDEIKKQKNDMRERFESISSLITDGIVTPVLKTFGKDAVRLTQATGIIENLTMVASKVPDLFKNLAKAMKMLTSPIQDVEGFGEIKETRSFKEFFDDGTAGIFESVFPQVVTFIDDVLLKNLSGFAGKYNMGEIVTTAQGFMNVVDATTRIIGGLFNVFQMMGTKIDENKVREIDIKTPIDMIMRFKDDFAENFQKIMSFIQNDVVGVYKKFQIPDGDIQLVTQNLMSISSLFEEFPKFFNSIAMLNPSQLRTDAAGKLVPYFTSMKEVQSGLEEAFTKTQYAAPGVTLKQNSLEKLINFINEQVLPPLKKIPNPDELKTHTEKLKGIGEVLGEINDFIVQKLSPLLVRGAGGIDNAIVAVLGENAGLFKGYFEAIADILNDGVMKMVQRLPGPAQVMRVAAALPYSIAILELLKPFFEKIAAFVKSTTDGSLTTIAHNRDSIYKVYEGISLLMYNGIYWYHASNLPSSASSATTVQKAAQASIDIMDALIPMYKKLKEFENATFTPEMVYISQNKDAMYDLYKSLTLFIWNGIFIPVDHNLPNSANLATAKDKINASSEMIKLMTSMFDGLKQMASLNMAGIDFNAIKNNLSSLTQNLGLLNLNSLANISPMNQNELDKLQVVIDSYDRFLDMLSSLETTMLGIARKLESISQIKFGKSITPPVAPTTPAPTKPAASDSIIDEIIKGWNSKLGNFEATFLKTGEILYKAEDGNTYTADKNVLGQRIYQKVDAQTVPVASPVSANLNDIESRLMAQKAGTTVPVNEIKSEELTNIADENVQQNEKLATLVDLFKKVVTFMTPTSQPNAGASNFGEALTMPKARELPPPRYARQTSGLPDTLPGKAVVNKGQISN